MLKVTLVVSGHGPGPGSCRRRRHEEEEAKNYYSTVYTSARSHFEVQVLASTLSFTFLCTSMRSVKTRHLCLYRISLGVLDISGPHDALNNLVVEHLAFLVITLKARWRVSDDMAVQSDEGHNDVLNYLRGIEASSGLRLLTVVAAPLIICNFVAFLDYTFDAQRFL